MSSSDKKLLLIQPSQIDSDGNIKKDKTSFLPRLALPQIAALTPDNYKITIIDEYLEDIDFNSDADLIGISATTPQAPRAYQISKEFRYRGKKVILGGMHASLIPEEAKYHADSIIIGEAENLWDKVLEDFENNNLKPVYKNSPDNLDILHIPSPRLDKLKLDKYEFPFRPVQTTRGCPHNCDYCSVTNFFGKSYRYRSIDDIVREVQGLDSKYVMFVDDNIAANPKRAKQLFKAITPLKINWTSQSTMAVAYDEELLELAQESGCANLMMGLESISAQSLATVNKSFNKVDDYHFMVERLHKHNITVLAFMIFGFDTDDETIFERTAKFTEDLKIDFPVYWILTPLPGTPFYHRMEAEGRIIERDWSKYDCTNVVFKPKLMSPETLQEGYYYACKRGYSFKNMMKKLTYPTGFSIVKHLWEFIPYFIRQHYKFNRKLLPHNLFLNDYQEDKS
ncbi:MAG: radical SAM protein [Bacteroidota bacterium]|nr:radical SAM protein [Bacteroidota bacterium]